KWEKQTSVGDLYGARDPGGPGQVNPNNRYSLALGYSQVFSPTFTASMNLGVQRWVSGGNGQGYGFKPATLGLPSALDSITPMFPQINFTSETNPLLAGLTSQYLPLGTSTQGSTPDQIGTISVDVTKVHGSQTLAFGYMGAFRQINTASIGKTS